MPALLEAATAARAIARQGGDGPTSGLAVRRNDRRCIRRSIRWKP